MLDKLEADVQREDSVNSTARDEVDIQSTYQVLIECRDEQQQQDLYEELTAPGLDCRLMML